MPFTLISKWLAHETMAGSVSPNRAVLSTVTSAGAPHSRVVAIREMKDDTVLFFTQRGTRKTVELAENPQASMTF